MIYLKDIDGNIHTIDSIFKKPSLVIRFSERNCEVCIKSEIELIDKSNIRNNVVGLASYSTSRALKLAKEKYNIQFPIYFLPFGESLDLLPNSMEEYGNPYLFLMSTNFHAKHVFFPSKEFPAISKKYYADIYYLLNNKYLGSEIFNESLVDLGTIKKYKTQKISFKYTNTSSIPLVIENVNSSCGCTIPQWDKAALKENESSELIVLFTPETSGYNSKIIMVSHNQSKHPIRLIFKANVIE
ncbi:DUF1573 domain-containing protein [Viscerimonas tarda]